MSLGKASYSCSNLCMVTGHGIRCGQVWGCQHWGRRVKGHRVSCKKPSLMSLYPTLLLPYPNLCFQPPVLPCTLGSPAWAWLFHGPLREWAVLVVVHAMPEMFLAEGVFFMAQRSSGLQEQEPGLKNISSQHQGFSKKRYHYKSLS